MSHSQSHDYHLVDPSPWPLLSSFSAAFMFVGAAMFMNDHAWGNWILPAGLFMIVGCMYGWWSDVINEGEKGQHHTNIVRHGLRIGMALFIVSEVMFFFAFFWAFFKAWLFPVVSFGEAQHLFEAGTAVAEGIWPPEGIITFDPWDLPLLNTLILLLSGTTVTWAHYALLHNDRKGLVRALAITVGLGLIFSCLQAYEYHHAAFGLSDGIYASNFYLATGFHGLHVIIGTLFLAVCLYRAAKGKMTEEGHLGFEFAAWYWHFVDVVWLFLFVFVYVFGA